MFAVATTKSLRCHTTGTHPQKTKIPIQQIEKHRADSNAANGMRIGNVPHYGRIHQSHQRNGDVRQNARYR